MLIRSCSLRCCCSSRCARQRGGRARRAVGRRSGGGGGRRTGPLLARKRLPVFSIDILLFFLISSSRGIRRGADVIVLKQVHHIQGEDVRLTALQQDAQAYIGG